MRECQPTKLIDVVTNPLQSIFYALQSFNVPWAELDININLDSDYMINHGGMKITSPLVDFFIDSETHKIDSTSMTLLANIIYTKYGNKWNKEYDTLSLEYNPISNYDMLEVMTNDQTVHQYGHTTTRTDNLNESAENKRAGFNSSDYQKDNLSTVDNTGTQTHAETGNNTDTRNYRLTRSGNIGVTTSQQMIESERALWLWDFFDKIVFPDVDKVLTISMY